MTDTLLTQANEIIYGPRADAYGEYEVGARRFIEMVNAYLRMHESANGFLRPITVEDAPALMIMLKLSRLADNPTHYDSWLDIAGYAGCAGKLPSVANPPKDELK